MFKDLTMKTYGDGHCKANHGQVGKKRCRKLRKPNTVTKTCNIKLSNTDISRMATCHCTN